MGSNSITMVGILVVLSLAVIWIPSSAQPNAPCWEKILPCLETAKAQNYPPSAVKPCCPALSNAATKEKSCFCLMQPDLVSQGADAVAIFNGILGTCSISGTMASICSGMSTYQIIF
ncbi:Subtilisin-like protease 4 [Bienertia sinuspersici]